MKKADNQFFEAFKELETLCGELYSCRSGVSEYLLDMEKRMAEGEKKIENWASDYKTLKHLRWVRNKIAHEAGDERISEDKDLDAVCAFRDRMIRGKDPITLLNKAKKAAKPASTRSSASASGKGKASSKKKQRKNLVPIVIAIELIILIIGLYFIFRMTAGL